MSKYFVNQIANGNMTVIAETDNLQTGIVSFHTTCKNLWNDANTNKAIVELVDDNFSVVLGYGDDTYTEYGGFREVIDKDNATVEGNIFVETVMNGSILSDKITEWGNVKGAMVDYHGKLASYWNAQDVTKARVKILNDNLDVFNGKSELVKH